MHQPVEDSQRESPFSTSIGIKNHTSTCEIDGEFVHHRNVGLWGVSRAFDWYHGGQYQGNLPIAWHSLTLRYEIRQTTISSAVDASSYPTYTCQTHPVITGEHPCRQSRTTISTKCRFWHGLNWRAPIAWILVSNHVPFAIFSTSLTMFPQGVWPNMPGFAATVTPKTVKVSQEWM